MKTYEAVRRFASGGMAEVLLAVPRTEKGLLDELVVLKRVLPQYRENNSVLRRFFAEGKLAASMKHPNVIAVHDVVEHDGEYSMVMEYLCGEDLRFLLSESMRASQRIPTHLACEIVLRVARALDYAHRFKHPDGSVRPVVHRDISPSNIMVTYDGRVKVVDFGLAKVLGAEQGSSPGHIKGKLPYVSPEQANGQDVDPRSDLFSLGALFHEMLTSKRLFGGPSEGAVIRNVMERYVPPPSVYNPDVSVTLDDIVLRLLQRAPADRTQSAAALVAELEHYQAKQRNPHDNRALGTWMSSAFGVRKQERQALQQEVKSNAENGQGWSKSTGLGLAFPNRSAHSGHSFSGAMTSHINSLSGSGASQTVSNPTTVSPALVAAASSKKPPYKLLGTLGVIVIGLLAVFAFQSAEKKEIVETPTPNLEVAGTTAPDVPKTTIEQPKPEREVTVALELHVLPAGAVAQILGQKERVTVHKSGALLPAPANTKVELQIEKEGYITKKLDLLTPDTGKTPVYINLDPAAIAVAAIAEEPEPEIDPGLSKEAARKAREAREDRRRDRIRKQKQAIAAATKARKAVEARNGTVVISYRPSNASVIVDGISRSGDSPIRLTLQPGPHTIRVSAEDHGTENRRIQLDAKQTESVDIRLKSAEPTYAEITVTSSPSGANIRVAGDSKGVTPQTIRVQPDRVAPIEVSKKGYKTWRNSVVPRASKLTRVNAPLEKEEEVVKKAIKPVRVPATAVKQVTGTLPVLRVANSGGTKQTKPIPVTLCINDKGAVTGIHVSVSGQLKKVLMASLGKWRFSPYEKNGVAVPVCFSKSYQLSIQEK